MQNSYAAKLVSESQTLTWAFEPVCCNSDCEIESGVLHTPALIQKQQQRDRWTTSDSSVTK